MKVGIVACSNGQRKEWKEQNEQLVDVLNIMGIEAVLSPHIMSKTDEFSGTDEERAADLMKFWTDDSIDAIYDISGGDLANGILKYLDYDLISPKRKVVCSNHIGNIREGYKPCKKRYIKAQWEFIH